MGPARPSPLPAAADGFSRPAPLADWEGYPGDGEGLVVLVPSGAASSKVPGGSSLGSLEAALVRFPAGCEVSLESALHTAERGGAPTCQSAPVRGLHWVPQRPKSLTSLVDLPTPYPVCKYYYYCFAAAPPLCLLLSLSLS